MDPNTSIGRLCLGENDRILLSDKIESEENWDGPEYQDTSDNGKRKEVKAFTFHRMETEEVWSGSQFDTAYWGFLGVGTTLDIFQNIIFIPYLEYGVLSLSGYGVLSFILCGLWVVTRVFYLMFGKEDQSPPLKAKELNSSEVLKLDLSSASLHSALVTIHPSSII
ncbi:hypothetical protein Tco_0868798 [Tanacetum coccineum]